MSTLKKELVALKAELVELTARKQVADKQRERDAAVKRANAIIKTLPKLLRTEAARGKSSCAVTEVDHSFDLTDKGVRLPYNEALIVQEHYGARLNTIIEWLHDEDLGAMFVYTEDTDYTGGCTMLMAFWE